MYIGWYDKSHADVAKMIVISHYTYHYQWFVVCIWNFPLLSRRKFVPPCFAEDGQDEDVLKASGLDGLMFLEFMSLGRRGSRWPRMLSAWMGWYLGCWSKRFPWFSCNGVKVVFWKPGLRGTIWNRDDIDVMSWPDLLEPKLGLEWRHLATHLHQLRTPRRFSCQVTFGSVLSHSAL